MRARAPMEGLYLIRRENDYLAAVLGMSHWLWPLRLIFLFTIVRGLIDYYSADQLQFKLPYHHWQNSMGMAAAISIAVLFKFWAHEILTKCWRNFRWNFRQYFGKISFPSPPPPKRNVRNFIYCCSVQILYFYRKFDNTIGNLIWLGLCDTNRI